MDAAVRAKRVIDEVRGVKSQYGVGERDWEFLNDLVRRDPRGLSPKQEEWLSDIERRVFGDDE